MRPGQEFIDFPRSDIASQLARITKTREANDKPRWLKVPLLIRHGDNVLLYNMTNARARDKKRASLNSCLNLPCLTINPLELDPEKLHFRSIVTTRTTGTKGIILIDPEDKKYLKASTRPLGVYKDYPLSRKKVESVITILPASMSAHRDRDEPRVRHDFRKIQGDTLWLPIDVAVAELMGQAEQMPDNNIAQDASAIIQIAAMKVFYLPETAKL